MSEPQEPEAFAEILGLFESDPSEALYRAEEELGHVDFIKFLATIAGNEA